MKYVPSYPKMFKNIIDALNWMEKFIDWYNNIYRHSAIGYITPAQRRRGKDKLLFAKRNEVLKIARENHPERWEKKIKIWERKEKIYLNKENSDKIKQKNVA